MSWWEVGNADCVIGDEPADVLRNALEDIARSAVSQGRPKPLVQDLLNAIERIMEGRERDYIAGHVPGHWFAARQGGRSVDLENLARLREALTEIADIYEDRWERKPTRREIANTLAFVIGDIPSEIVSDIDDRALNELLRQDLASLFHAAREERARRLI